MTITQWEIWTAAVIPALGVLASSAVAVAAVIVSRNATRIAAAAHAEVMGRDSADQRRHFADAILNHLETTSAQLRDSPLPMPRPRQLMTHAATLKNQNAAAIVEWLIAATARTGLQQLPDPSARRAAFAKEQREVVVMIFLREVERRIIAWVADPNAFNLEPFTPPSPPIPSGDTANDGTPISRRP